jgi:hypothetical protein
MKAKKWITIYFLFIITVVISLQSILIYNKIPPRFSNSLSYDAKLNFIHNGKLLENADTLVIGSSMSLNNISGIALEDDSIKIKKVANIASWGLSSEESLKFLQLINLKKIKYIIYSTEYDDFTDRKQEKDIDIKNAIAYLDNEFVLKPYLKRFSTAYKNIKNYFFYKKIYLNPNSYTSLLFDRTGSVNFTFSQEYYNKERWNSTREYDDELSQKSFESLKKMVDIANAHNIKMIVTTSPVRLAFLKTHPIAQKKMLSYVKELKKLSKEKSFIYINAHEILQLDDSCFLGATHLNKSGATLFSKIILQKSKIF